jgi:hypothetical protein
MPQCKWCALCGAGGPARLFVVSDRDVLRRLDLLKEEFGNAPRV